MARRNLPPRSPQLDLSGALSVAFVNTAGARPDNSQLGVDDYAELLVWGQQAEIVSPLEAARLTRVAQRNPEAAEAVYDRTARLRRSLTGLFVAVSNQAAMPGEDLALFNEELARSMSALLLVPGKTGLTWGWVGDEDALDRVLWPVLRSAAELLISVEGQPHVRQCAAVDCRLFFVDRTPSRQRKWCDMKTCGNRAKGLRHYHRTGRAKRERYVQLLGLRRHKRPRKARKSRE